MDSLRGLNYFHHETKLEEKAKAEEQFEDAMKSGKEAAMGRMEKTGDIFQISLGNLDAHDSVRVEFVYLAELTEFRAKAELQKNYSF